MGGVEAVKSFRVILVLAVAAMFSAQAAPSSAQEVFENLRKTFSNIAKPPAETKPAATGQKKTNVFANIKRAFADVGALQASPGGPLPPEFRRTTVSYPAKEAAGTIVIDSGQHYLYYVLGNGKAIRYGIGVGREGFGWRGTVKIGRKAEWPGWTPPPEMIERERKKGIILPAYMDGGVKNPLGARALYLYNGSGDTAYRIHGSNEPWTIGHNVSSGCFRMVNRDVIDLYKRAQVGAKVIVR
jgi:lipoprotein-anchoring transpeptidase ErfK/SrfK